MSNCLKYNSLEPIVDRNQDHTLSNYPHHNVFTHLGCVILRIIIGMIIVNTELTTNQKNSVSVMFFVFALVFLIKYIKVKESPLWKSYIRSITSYTVCGILSAFGKTELAGMLFISDSIFSIQARHTASIVNTC